MKHGARNDLPGEVTAIKKGDVMCQVGDKVNVIAKAVNVLLMRS